MSIRKHRDKAEGKKPRGRRMPPSDQIKMGTRVQEHKKLEDEEFTENVDKCSECDNWIESIELDQYHGMCLECYSKNE